MLVLPPIHQLQLQVQSVVVVVVGVVRVVFVVVALLYCCVLDAVLGFAVVGCFFFVRWCC